MPAAAAIPLSLYIHTPWCVQKCPYCDFNSHALRGDLPEQIYVKALLDDLKGQLPAIDHRPIQTIFIGGGTPSLFSPDAFETLFDELRRHLTIVDSAEITLEANPGTVEQTHFKGYREIGINRLSIGVQSFQNDKLKSLGRIHNANEAVRAIEIAKEAGFNNFNIDLMYGLPEQTIDDALSDLQTAFDQQPTHLSWYHLTLEPNTYFYKFPPALPNDDAVWDMQDNGHELIHENGFEHYEVSAHSKPNYPCHHNVNYWEFGDYIGIGAGAHSKITHDVNIQRHWNVKHPKDYLNPDKPFIADQKQISKKELPLEFMMNALRLQQPIPVDLLLQRTGLTLDNIQPTLDKAQHLLTLEDSHFVVSTKGRRYLNELLELFLPPDPL